MHLFEVFTKNTNAKVVYRNLKKLSTGNWIFHVKTDFQKKFFFTNCVSDILQ